MPTIESVDDELPRTAAVGSGDDDIQGFDVHVRETSGSEEAPDIKGMMGSQAAIERRAAQEGATIVNIPLGTDPLARAPTPIPTQQLGDICHTLIIEADALRKRYPHEPCDRIRARIIAQHPDLYASGFFRMFPSIFMLLTAADVTPVEKQKGLQTILIKQKLVNGEITGEQANSLLGSLMGVSKEKQKQLFEALRKLDEAEAQNPKRGPSRRR